MEKETCIKCGSVLYYDMRKINIKDKGIAINIIIDESYRGDLGHVLCRECTIFALEGAKAQEKRKNPIEVVINESTMCGYTATDTAKIIIKSKKIKNTEEILDIAIKALKQIPVQTQNQQVVKEW